MLFEEINTIRPFDGSHITLYPYGSRVYGTATYKSDYDFICVCSHCAKPKNELSFSFGDVTYYTIEEFRKQLLEHEISVLECLWTKPIVDELSIHFFPVIDKAKLRVAISAKASNSWVKCKKKLTVGSVVEKYPYDGERCEGKGKIWIDDGIDDQDSPCPGCPKCQKTKDREIGLKSLFHAFRIIDFGYQIATQGKIISYSSVNYLWDELKDFTGTWEQLNEKYKAQFNKAHSEFRKVAPKSKEDSLLESFKTDDPKTLAEKLEKIAKGVPPNKLMKPTMMYKGVNFDV